MKKDLQNGRSMIEMLGVLSIIGILTVGGFGLVSKTVTENKINKLIDEVSDLARHTRIVFNEYIYECKSKSSATPKVCDGSNLDMTTYLHNAKAYPDVLEYSASGNTGKFTDDEDVGITVAYKEISSIGYYVLTVTNLSEEFCMAMASGQWGTAATNGFSGIAVAEKASGNTSVSIPSDLIGSKVSLDTAAAKCGDGSSVFLAFR